MKASEMMIGDWVQNTNSDIGRVIGFQFYSASERNEVVIRYALNSTCWSNEEMLKPIPLTAEIIGNNIPFNRNWDSTRNDPSGSVTEWRKDTSKAFIFVYDFRNGDGTYVIEIRVRDAYEIKVRLILRYVHELQHALRLCGLTELANNFKVNIDHKIGDIITLPDGRKAEVVEGFCKDCVFDNKSGCIKWIEQGLIGMCQQEKRTDHKNIIYKEVKIMEHELKITSGYLQDVIDGRKTFEVRQNDRNFNEGDTLVLREYSNGRYLSCYAKVRVIYILNDTQYCKEGYVILGIQLLTFGSMD